MNYKQYLKKEHNAVLYLLEYNREKHCFEVENVIFFQDRLIALTAYAEIPNPPSQLLVAETSQLLAPQMDELEQNLNNPRWVSELLEAL